jgi:hypothetical protein
MIFIIVVLPQPDGPVMAKLVPAGMSKERPRKIPFGVSYIGRRSAGMLRSALELPQWQFWLIKDQSSAASY